MSMTGSFARCAWRKNTTGTKKNMNFESTKNRWTLKQTFTPLESNITGTRDSSPLHIYSEKKKKKLQWAMAKRVQIDFVGYISLGTRRYKLNANYTAATMLT